MALGSSALGLSRPYSGPVDQHVRPTGLLTGNYLEKCIQPIASAKKRVLEWETDRAVGVRSPFIRLVVAIKDG